MSILQGEIYWIDFGEGGGSKARGVYPGVIIQRDSINKSRINTVLVCMITSTLERADDPGNVLIYAGGESGLRNDSVINVSLTTHVNKADLGDKIGLLNMDQLQEVVDGVQSFLKVPSFRI